MATWITLDEACHRLGVRPQTLYAYVSRGKVEAAPDAADPRRSLYRADDIDGLVRRKQAGRKHETLATNTLFGVEPSIPTSLSSFARGRLFYRGRDAVDLAGQATLEDLARLLWQTAEPVDFAARPSLPTSAPNPRGIGRRPPGRSAAFERLAGLAATGHSTHGRVTRVLHEEAQALVGDLALAFGATLNRGTPLHLGFATAWGLTAPQADLLRLAQALLADHELTSSAFATRIAASTGASLPACLLAGLMTLSGPMHGDASGRVKALFDEVEHRGDERVVDHYLSAALPIPGFGHHLYPDGDPRAAALLAGFTPPKAIARFIEKVVRLTGLEPNIDAALAALVTRLRLPGDAAFALFATARSVGLLAHAIEQLETARVIRPRGRYTGPMPVPEAAVPGQSSQSGDPGRDRAGSRAGSRAPAPAESPGLDPATLLTGAGAGAGASPGPGPGPGLRPRARRRGAPVRRPSRPGG